LGTIASEALMDEANGHDQIKREPMVDDSNVEDISPRNYWIPIASVAVIVFLAFNIVSPFWFEKRIPPRKVDYPDIILIAIIFLFNSKLLNRLEDFGISRAGGITAKFSQLKQEVSEQKIQIDSLQAQQLEQLAKQQLS